MATKQKLKRKLRRQRIRENDLRIVLESANYRAHFAELHAEQLANDNNILRSKIEELELHNQFEADVRADANELQNGSGHNDEYMSEVVS
jgi:hypothetical protein